MLNKKNLNLFIIFENKAIFSFLFSGVIASIGNWIYIVGMTALIYKELGVLGVAIFGLLRQSTYLIFSPIAGYLIDNFPRKKLIFLSMVGNVFAMIILALLVKTQMDSVYLYVLIILILVFTGSIDYPARLAIAPRLVDDSKLLILNSNSYALNTLAIMIAPLISGAVMSINGLNMLFLLNVIVFMIALVLILFIPHSIDTVVINKSKKTEKNYVSTIYQNWVEGFKFIWTNKQVMNANVFLFFNHILVGSVYVFIPVLSENIDQGEVGIGYLIAINGVGCVLGTLLSSYIPEKKWTNIITLSAIGLGLTTIILPFSLTIFGCYTLVLLIGFFSMFGEAPLMTTIQRNIPNEEAGRIYAAVDTIIIGSMGLGSFLIGLLFEHSPFKLAFIVIGLIPLLSIIISFISKKEAHRKVQIESEV
jgi:MFS transporter, DHA3 family, macrolide efflux protein